VVLLGGEALPGRALLKLHHVHAAHPGRHPHHLFRGGQVPPVVAPDLSHDERPLHAIPPRPPSRSPRHSPTPWTQAPAGSPRPPARPGQSGPPFSPRDRRLAGLCRTPRSPCTARRARRCPRTRQPGDRCPPAAATLGARP